MLALLQCKHHTSWFCSPRIWKSTGLLHLCGTIRPYTKSSLLFNSWVYNSGDDAESVLTAIFADVAMHVCLWYPWERATAMTLKNFSPFHLACINYQACRHLFANCKWWLMPLHMSLQSGPIFQSHYDSLLSLWGSLSCVTTSVCFRLIGPVSILVFETPCPYTESQWEYDKTQYKKVI